MNQIDLFRYGRLELYKEAEKFLGKLDNKAPKAILELAQDALKQKTDALSYFREHLWSNTDSQGYSLTQCGSKHVAGRRESSLFLRIMAAVTRGDYAAKFHQFADKSLCANQNEREFISKIKKTFDESTLNRCFDKSKFERNLQAESREQKNISFERLADLEKQAISQAIKFCRSGNISILENEVPRTNNSENYVVVSRSKTPYENVSQEDDSSWKDFANERNTNASKQADSNIVIEREFDCEVADRGEYVVIGDAKGDENRIIQENRETVRQAAIIRSPSDASDLDKFAEHIFGKSMDMKGRILDGRFFILDQKKIESYFSHENKMRDEGRYKLVFYSKEKPNNIPGQQLHPYMRGGKKDGYFVVRDLQEDLLDVQWTTVCELNELSPLGHIRSNISEGRHEYHTEYFTLALAETGNQLKKIISPSLRNTEDTFFVLKDYVSGSYVIRFSSKVWGQPISNENPLIVTTSYVTRNAKTGVKTVEHIRLKLVQTKNGHRWESNDGHSFESIDSFIGQHKTLFRKRLTEEEIVSNLIECPTIYSNEVEWKKGEEKMLEGGQQGNYLVHRPSRGECTVSFVSKKGNLERIQCRLGQNGNFIIFTPKGMFTFSENYGDLSKLLASKYGVTNPAGFKEEESERKREFCQRLGWK